MRKVYVISPREPCGATWLLNCFLELGVLTWRVSRSNMWVRRGDEYVLHPREELLKKWMPALTDRAAFRFRADVEVEWAHAWRTRAHDDVPVLFFQRDPRDALVSSWRRERPPSSLAEYLSLPDSETLLDRTDHWRLFTTTWLRHPRLHVVRFEDYRSDARGTLEAALDFAGIDARPEDVDRAIGSSTFERARDAERTFETVRGSTQRIINSGVAGAFRSLVGDDRAAVAEMERRAEATMAHFGYARELSDEASPTGDLGRHVRLAPFFDALPCRGEELPPGDADAVGRTLAFAASVDAAAVRRSGLDAAHHGRLLANLALYARRAADDAERRLQDVASELSTSADFAFELLKRTRRLKYLIRTDPKRMVQRSVRKLRIFTGRL